MNELRTLPQALAAAALGDAGYVFVDGRHQRSRSYADIRAESLVRARALRAMGLQRGDVVALIVANEEQFLTSLFGASIAGLVPASLYPPTRTTDLPRYLEATAGMLRLARARAVITSPSLTGAMQNLRPVCPDLAIVVSSDLADCAGRSSTDRGDLTANGEPDDRGGRNDLGALADPGAVGDLGALADLGAVADLGARADLGVLGDLDGDTNRETISKVDDIALVQFTSGSTSRPKGVAITHRSLAANIDAIDGQSGLDASDADSAVSWLPLYHDMGLVGMALGAMYRRRPAVLMTPETFVKRPVEWLRAISEHRATVSFAPTFAYDLCVRRVKERDLDGVDLSCWRVAGCGAEPIHTATLAAFADKFRSVGFRETSFMASYGLAEHVVAATLAPLGRAIRVDRRTGVDLASCGSPLPGHRVRIVADDGREAQEGATGEIALAGPSVMLGYYGDDTMTADTIRDGWLYTGDLGYLADGELFVCGRNKDTVVVNGRKHHPQDLERAVDDLPGVRRGRVVAFGASRAGLADRLVMVVEPTGAVPPDELTRAIRHRVSDVFGLYVDDLALVASGTISRTTSGKVRRFATRIRYEAGDFRAAPASLK